MAVNREKVIKSAEKHIKAGRLDSAISEYLILLKENPKDWQTRNQVGDLYFRLGKQREAGHHWTEMAEFYAQDGFTLKAIAMYTKVRKIDPQNTGVLLKLAELNVKQGLINEARPQYLEVAEILKRQNKLNEALEVYRRLVDLDRDNVKMRITLAELYAKEKMFDQAIEEFTKAAEDLRRKGLTDECVHVLNQAMEIGRANPAAVLTLANVKMDMGHKAQAIKMVEEALQGEPHEARFLKFLGDTFQKENDVARAEQYYKRLFEVDPGTTENLLRLGQGLLKRNELDRAYALFEPIVNSLVKQREGEKAVGLLRSVLNASPSHVPTLNKLVEIYSAFKQRSNLIAALTTLSDAHQSAGRTGEALAAIERVIEIDPENYQHRERLLRVKGEKEAPGYQPPEEQTEPQPRGAPGARRAPSPPVAAQPRPGISREIHEAAPARKMAELPPISAEGSEELKAQITELLTEADVFMRYKLFDKAQEQLMQAISLDERNLRAHARLKEIYEEKSLGAEALAECVLLSELYEESGDIETARQMLADGATIDPKDQRLLARIRELEMGGKKAAEPAEEPAPAAPPPSRRAAAPPPRMPEPEEPAEELEIDLSGLEIEAAEEAAKPARVEAAPPVPDVVKPRAAPVPPAPSEPAEVAEIDLDFVSFEEEPGRQVEAESPEVMTRPLFEAEEQPKVSTPPRKPPAPQPAPAPPPPAPPVVARQESIEKTTPAMPVPSFEEVDVDADELLDLKEEVERFSIELEDEVEAPVTEAEQPVQAAPEAPELLFDVEIEEEEEVQERPAEPVAPPVAKLQPPPPPPPPPTVPVFELRKPSPPIAAKPPDKKKLTLDELLMEDIAELEAFVKDAGKPAPPKPGRAAPPPRKVVEEEEVPSDLISTLDEVDLIEDAGEAGQFPLAASQADDLLGGGPLGGDQQEDRPFDLSLEDRVEITAVTVPPAEAEPASAVAESAQTDFFDLSSELEKELLKAETARQEEEQDIVTDESQAYQEKSLEELFTEFRQGIDKQLGQEDFDTRYNLGIAYKEMGLIDEAIGEFQTAARDPERLLECCSLLGLCFMEKGMPKQAIQWLKKGIESPGHREEEYQGLRYDLGLAYQQLGELGKAMDAFKDVFGFNANYRSVSDRIKETEKMLARSKGK